MLMVSIYVASTVPLSAPGRGIPHLWLSMVFSFSLKGFLKFFLTQFESLRTDVVTTVQNVKAPPS